MRCIIRLTLSVIRGALVGTLRTIGLTLQIALFGIGGLLWFVLSVVTLAYADTIRRNARRSFTRQL